MALDDELLAHHITTIKHAAALGWTAEPYIEAMKDAIRKKVSGFDSDKRTAKRLEKLIKDLAEVLGYQAAGWQEQLRSDLKAFAEYEANYQANVMGEWLKMDLVAPSLEQVWAAATFEPMSLGQGPVDFLKLADDWGSDEVARLTMGVKSGFVQGHSIKRIIKEVVGAGGLADVSERNAMTVAQTMIAHVASEARMETYAENSDVVIGYRWVSTLDSRTSNFCRAMDGKKIKWADKVKPKPPAHYRCRSSTAPLLDEEFDFLDEGAERASRGADGGKPVSANLSYYQWLKTQPAGFQDEVLGVTKGKIFRNSGLDAEEFRAITVDDLGRPLTLTEMGERDKRVSDYLKAMR